jgi:hypothetical protein
VSDADDRFRLKVSTSVIQQETSRRMKPVLIEEREFAKSFALSHSSPDVLLRNVPDAHQEHELHMRRNAWEN